MATIVKKLNGHWKLIVTSVITLSLAAIPALQGYAVLKNDTEHLSKVVDANRQEIKNSCADIQKIDRVALENKTILQTIRTDQMQLRDDIKVLNKDRNEDMAELKALLRRRIND